MVCVAIIATSIPTANGAPGEESCQAVPAVRPTARDWSGRLKEMHHLIRWQAFRNSTHWRLTPRGLVTCRGPVRISKKQHYRVKTVPKAWRRYGTLIRAAANKYRVPAELFVTIIINESGLRPKSFQTYSGYVDDRKTPHRISVGLGAVLISTARYMLKDDTIDRAWLQNPENTMRMIGVYLDRRYRITGFDPVKVAGSYNAGGLHHQKGPANRWKLRNYPIGKSIYIDHFVAVFDEAMRFLSARPDRPRESFAALFAGEPTVPVKVRIPESWSRRPSTSNSHATLTPTETRLLTGGSSVAIYHNGNLPSGLTNQHRNNRLFFHHLSHSQLANMNRWNRVTLPSP